MDKAQLFGPRVGTASGMPEDDVEVEGVGVVRVRGLSRTEALELRRIDDLAVYEQQTLAFALLDPVLTVDEVAKWQVAALAGEMEPVVDKVIQLSGLADDAAKEAVKAFVADPDLEFRVLPGTEAGDDGGPDAAGDAG